MNNIYFFNHFNNLLKTYNDNHKNINNLIKDKMNDNTVLSQNELYVINKYNDINDILELFLDNVSSISNDIKIYLKENCSHEWTTDFIDIDSERNRQIKYCNYCSTDFFDYNV